MIGTGANAKRVLAVVPARGGSKGIPLKNLRQVAGKSLVAHVGDVVRAIPEFDRSVVSTEHPEIAKEAEKAGIAAPFFRPKDLSGDRVGDIPVLQHALVETEKYDGVRYDIVVMLQPTSPLRRAEEVLDTLRRLVDANLDSVWTVSQTDMKSHPLKQLTLTGGILGYYNTAGADVISRQQLTPVFHRNGVAYALTRSCVMEQQTLMGKRSSAVILDAPHVSIDTTQDLDAASTYFQLRRQD